jgi:AraC-like DNA-binding protein
MKGATVADFRERFVVDEFLSSCSCPESPKRVTMKATTEIGSLKVDQLWGRHFSVSKVDLHFKYNTVIEVKDNLADKVGFYLLDHGRGGIPLFGESRYSNSGIVSGGDCYVAFNPSLNEIHQFDAQTAKPLYMEVTAEYFKSLLDENDRFTGSLREKIQNREFFGMKTRLTSSHYRIVHNLYDCPLQGSLGNLMLEGGLQQFVALQLSTFVHPSPVTASLNRRDKDVMHAVKEYLHSTFQENHSLLELSRHFGISQSKLKKAFKELFGVPVIEYLYDLKMQHAKNLLYDQRMNVGEVSSMVGYKNANHFATAFKRKFGVNPSKV